MQKDSLTFLLQKEGAKFPPFPPLNMVKEVAKAFKTKQALKI
jgi:hypothetical protein